MEDRELNPVQQDKQALNLQGPEFTIYDLPRGTPGSAGLDLSCREDVLLSLCDRVAVISTEIVGTLPPQTVGLILGRRSNTATNFEVLPGVLDADTMKDIKVMIRPLKETIQLHKGQRIAQIVLLPYVNLPAPIMKGDRGQGQFGSTDSNELVAWVQSLCNRPFKVIQLEGKPVQGLLDTGADRTCIAGKDWSSSWPIHKTGSSLTGLGMASGVMQSSKVLKRKTDNKEGMIQPYVLPSLPFTLWGRDLMESLDIQLVSVDSETDQHFS